MNPVRVDFVQPQRNRENPVVLFQQGLQRPAHFFAGLGFGYDGIERERTHRGAEFEPVSEYRPRHVVNGPGPNIHLMNDYR